MTAHNTLLNDPDLLCKELILNRDIDVTMFHHANLDYIWIVDCFNKRAIAYVCQGCADYTDTVDKERLRLFSKFPEMGDLERIPGTRYLGIRVWEYDLRYLRAYDDK